MKIIELKDRPGIEKNDRLHKSYTQYASLLSILDTKELTDETKISINTGTERLNSLQDTEKDFKKTLRKIQYSTVKLIEKEYKLVPKNYYRNMWMVVGMSAFGVPIGVAFGVSQGNMSFIGTGFPIGMVIGLALGTRLDKKALAAGRQLDMEIKY